MDRPTAPQVVLLGVNERARRGQGAQERAAATLRAAGHEVEIAPCADGKLSAAIAAARDRIDAVAIGGGDGTLTSALDGLVAAGVPLLILPLGTINELARTLQIPQELEAACALLDHGRRKPLDVASVNGHRFFNEASIGFSTHVAERQTGEVKKRLGLLTVPVTTLQALRAMRPYRLEVETETGVRTFVTAQLTVANSYRFGAVVENDNARLDDGVLDLYSVDIRSPLDALSLVGAIARRRFPEARCVTDLRGTRFVVRSRRRHHVAADGEPVTQTPAEFTIQQHAIEAFVPVDGGHA